MTDAVGDVESAARGPLARTVENLAAIVYEWAMRVGLSRGIRDFSLGEYQLRLTTIARFEGVPFSKDGGRVIFSDALRRPDAPTQATELRRLANRRDAARVYAARRISEALSYGHAHGLTPVLAIARLYGGELEATPGHPYAKYLASRLMRRMHGCSAPCRYRRWVAEARHHREGAFLAPAKTAALDGR